MSNEEAAVQQRSFEKSNVSNAVRRLTLLVQSEHTRLHWPIETCWDYWRTHQSVLRRSPQYLELLVRKRRQPSVVYSGMKGKRVWSPLIFFSHLISKEPRFHFQSSIFTKPWQRIVCVLQFRDIKQVGKHYRNMKHKTIYRGWKGSRSNLFNKQEKKILQRPKTGPEKSIIFHF